MSNFLENIDQYLIGVFAIVIMCYSFKALNYCTPDTRPTIRIAMILFLSGSVGALLLLVSGIHINWPVGLVITAAAIFTVADRRNHMPTSGFTITTHK